MYQDFYDLEVWKQAREFRKEIAKMTKRLPEFEKNKLVDQITRSARSCSANIAEAHGRFHKGEMAQFSRHSRGSLKETLDHLYCALDEGYISQEEFNKFFDHYKLCLKLMNGYLNYLNNRAA